MSDDEAIPAVDDFMAVTNFTELLESLSAQKQKKLTDAVRFGMANARYANDLIEALLKCIDENADDHKKRLLLLLLVDRLMKQSSDKMHKSSANTPDCATYVERFMSEMTKLMELVVPGPDVIATTVRKVQQGWKKSLSTHYEHYKSEFDEAEAYIRAQESQSTLLQISEDTQQLIHSLFRPQQSKTGVGAGNEDHKREHAEIQRKIEEDRDKHKKLREESWIRADSFPDPYAVGEWWSNGVNTNNNKTAIILSNVEADAGQYELVDLWNADVNTLKSTFWDQLVVEAKRARADLDNDPPNSTNLGSIIGGEISNASGSTPR